MSLKEDQQKAAAFDYTPLLIAIVERMNHLNDFGARMTVSQQQEFNFLDLAFKQVQSASHVKFVSDELVKQEATSPRKDE